MSPEKFNSMGNNELDATVIRIDQKANEKTAPKGVRAFLNAMRRAGPSMALGISSLVSSWKIKPPCVRDRRAAARVS